jgi:ATP-dependent Lon protease
MPSSTRHSTKKQPPTASPTASQSSRSQSTDVPVQVSQQSTVQENQPTQSSQTAELSKESTAVPTNLSTKKMPYQPLHYTTTADIAVPTSVIDSIIGQESAVDLIKKAAKQRRHVLLVGEPGTGKSLLGVALASLLPKEKLVDVLSFANQNDENQPLVRVVPAGEGRKLVSRFKAEQQSSMKGQSIVLFIVFAVLSLIPYWLWKSGMWPDVVFAASMIASMVLFIGIAIMFNLNKRMAGKVLSVPKIVVDNADTTQAPFIDATGSHAGALLGDVLHDPFQSGGLGTPAHERVIGGMIHKSNLGVLFLDEIATLSVQSQQELLTAIQEGKFAITGQSERSAGAMVRTEPVPCNFILVAAGNMDSVSHMHPALRSRIRGYGYEVYMKEHMKDTLANRDLLARFVAQEIAKDKKIPHFSKQAVHAIIEQARKKANRKNHLTLRLRELGGLIRAAGDYAVSAGATLVEPEHILAVQKSAQSLEGQIAHQIIERKKEYEVLVTSGTRVGRVNGLAVIGDGSSYSGIVLPIEAQVVTGTKDEQGKIVATGKLGDIAKEAVINVSALAKKLFDKDLSSTSVYIQFLQTYEGVEGDSASIAIACAIISCVGNIPLRQDTAMTGSLSVRGTILPIGGATYKVEAAIGAGITRVLVPSSNMQDIVLSAHQQKLIEIIEVKTVHDVLVNAFDWTGKKDLYDKIHKKLV